MSKIIVLQGVPGSGKSTWAKEFAQAHKDYVIVCRDSIREGTGVYWVPERENYISDVEKNQIEMALDNYLNVIIDATNLNPKTILKWNDLAEKHNAEIEYKLFEISYEEALERDRKRGENGGRSVGEETIKRFFKNYFPNKLGHKDTRHIKLPDPTKEDVIVCDLDGTVAIHNGRNAYDLSRVKEDTFDPRMKKLLRYLAYHMKIIFVSGREGTAQCMKDTKEWITKNLADDFGYLTLEFEKDFPRKIPQWEVIFRKEGDHRNDAIVKEEIYKEQIEPYYNIVTVFDDRDRVVKMWRDNGVLCSQVYYGDF
jgi:predicted kinase